MFMNTKGYLAAVLVAFSLSTVAADGPLIEAVKGGDINLVMTMLDNRVDVNQPAADGTTALAHAAYRNDLAMLELLLIKGEAEVNIANDYGATALYMAAGNADAELILRLLRAGADPNIGLLSGETPLMVTANRSKLEAARLLLEHSADPNARETRGGQTALMWAVAEHHPNIVNLLIEHKADVNTPSNTGFTPLMFAAQQGDAESAQAFLKAGAVVDAGMFRSGLTPLMIASIGGFEDVARVLLVHGADVDTIDKNGKAVLHHAVTYTQSAVVVRELLARGANPNIQLQSPKKYTGNYIDPQGSTPLLQAAGLNNLEALIALLDAGADPKIPTATNTTALMMAAGANVPPDGAVSDFEVENATQIVKLLLDLGLDANAVGQFGWTAMHSAAYQGRSEIIKELIARGANTEIMDMFGQTPLSISYAIVTEGLGDAYRQTPRTYHKETVDLLLSLGATPMELSGVKIVRKRAAIK
jgi:ankyrin repeat protein